MGDEASVGVPSLAEELNTASADVEAALRLERAQQRQRELNAFVAGTRVRVHSASHKAIVWSSQHTCRPLS